MPVERKRACINIAELKIEVNNLNDLLATAIPQEAKRRISSTIGALLMKAGLYNGFQYLYWAETGCKAWRDAGEPNFPEKEAYVIGPEGAAHKHTLDKAMNWLHSEWVHPTQGEYARCYYISPVSATEDNCPRRSKIKM